MAAATNLLRAHAFAGNPLRMLKLEPSSAVEALTSALAPGADSTLDLKVLPFRKGRPLARSSSSSSSATADAPPVWRLAWLPPSVFANHFSPHSFVFLGGDGFTPHSHWAVDVSSASLDFDVSSSSSSSSAFVDLRTLMVATDWADHDAMGQLAIAGQAKALLEWHNMSQFCGHCGATMTSLDAGRRKQCTAESCKKRMYPRVDPVVIMLVIDKENDCALLSRQSRFVPRLWSCLAGFIEPGECLEEAVRRETLEETGVEVGEVVYHSSQPWPVGPSSMPCQLMVGFFAYAKTLEIRVDKMELEDARWHSREDVRRALASAEYEKAQRTSAARVDQICKGAEKAQRTSAARVDQICKGAEKAQGGLSPDFKVESAELATIMFVPGPYAIAHHLISSWVGDSVETPAQRSSSSSSSSL